MRVLWLLACLTIGLISPAESNLRSASPMMGDGVQRVGPAGPQGPQGEPGSKGDKGDAGPKGDTGSPGAAGVAGPAGAAGGTGPQGPAGVAGPKGDAGAAGSAGPQGLTGAKGDAGPSGPSGAPGAAGAVGPAGPQGQQGSVGPKASTFVCTTTLSDIIVVGLSSGVKSKAGVSCAGVLTTDILEIYPSSPSSVPEGVAIHHAFPTAANTLRLVYSVPSVTLLTNLNIPVAIYSVSR